MIVGFGGAGQESSARVIMLVWWRELWDSYSLMEALLFLTLTSLGKMPQSLQSSLGRQAAPSTYCACGPGS